MPRHVVTLKSIGLRVCLFRHAWYKQVIFATTENVPINFDVTAYLLSATTPDAKLVQNTKLAALPHVKYKIRGRFVKMVENTKWLKYKIIKIQKWLAYKMVEINFLHLYYTLGLKP